MGCNSHLSIEVKYRWSTDTSWSVWALDLPESRDYDLYEAMAGVRGEDGKELFLPRGIPTDVTQGTGYWIKRAGEDGHSHSWLTPKEFHACVVQATPDAKEWLSLDAILTTLEQVYGDGNARLIFFFDN